MTAVEQARLAGIRAQQAVRARSVIHARSGRAFPVLADHVPGFKARPKAEGEFHFGSEERSQDELYAVRIDLEDTVVAVGDELVTPQGQSFRVVAIEDSSNDLLICYTVEVARD